MLKVTLLAFNDGVIATVKVTLTNTSSETLGSIDIRAPVPAGMALLDSAPSAVIVPGQVAWVHQNLAPARSVTLRYRIHTHGFTAMATATAVTASQTYVSDPFPIGAVASPARTPVVPNLAPVP